MAEVAEDERRRLAERIFGPGAEPTPSELREFASLRTRTSPEVFHPQQDTSAGVEVCCDPTQRKTGATPRPSSWRVGLVLLAIACGFLGGAGIVTLGGNAPDRGLPEAEHIASAENAAPNPNDWALNSLISMGAYGDTDVWLALSEDRARECIITGGADGSVTCKPAGSAQELSSGSIEKRADGSSIRRTFTVETSNGARKLQATVELIDATHEETAARANL